jgi:hypothetical protein
LSRKAVKPRAYNRESTVFYELLMWFWPVIDKIEIVSGMPAPQFGIDSKWVQGSEQVQGPSGSCASFWFL